MKTIHIAEMIAQGGRDGRVEAADGAFGVDLSTNEEPGSVTPEHLFAGAYAACYLGALKSALKKATSSRRESRWWHGRISRKTSAEDTGSMWT